MKFWILVMSAVALLVWSLSREGFDGKRPSPSNPELRRTVAVTTGIPVNLTSKIDEVIAKMGLFWDEVYQPTQKTPTDEEVVLWVQSKVPNTQDRAGLEGAIADWFGASSGPRNESAPAPVCPVGTILREEDSKCVAQAASGSLTCPSGYTLGRDKKCLRNGGSEKTDPTCPSGFVYNSTAQTCDSTPVDPTCPSGYKYKDKKCVRKTPSPSSPGSSTPAPTPGLPSSAGSSTTTGGGSVSSYGPTTGGPTNRLRQVFGPQFTERGNEVGNGGGDSSQTNVYPELLGGMIDSSSRIPGAGIRPPSKNWTLTKDGSLPSSQSMGADEMSRYFPYSRTPGDMDVIPDPYRVAQTFSASSYASKTEPVPFLTDFSAFQK